MLPSYGGQIDVRFAYKPSRQLQAFHSGSIRDATRAINDGVLQSPKVPDSYGYIRATGD